MNRGSWLSYGSLRWASDAVRCDGKRALLTCRRVVTTSWAAVAGAGGDSGRRRKFDFAGDARVDGEGHQAWREGERRSRRLRRECRTRVKV